MAGSPGKLQSSLIRDVDRLLLLGAPHGQGHPDATGFTLPVVPKACSLALTVLPYVQSWFLSGCLGLHRRHRSIMDKRSHSDAAIAVQSLETPLLVRSAARACRPPAMRGNPRRVNWHQAGDAHASRSVAPSSRVLDTGYELVADNHQYAAPPFLTFHPSCHTGTTIVDHGCNLHVAPAVRPSSSSWLDCRGLPEGSSAHFALSDHEYRLSY